MTASCGSSESTISVLSCLFYGLFGLATYTVKITVLECVEPSRLYDPVPINTETGKPHVSCPVHMKGQVFTARGTGTPPEGFCANAWHDIKEYVAVLMHGGSYYPWLAENEMIRCCTDGLRPVIFKIERLEDPNNLCKKEHKKY